MAQLSITKTYQDSPSISLTEADLDGIKDSIEAFVNVTGLGADNVADDSVTSDQLVNGSIVTAKLSDFSVPRSALSVLNYAISSSSGIAASTITATITTEGRPVLLTCQTADVTVTNAYVIFDTGTDEVNGRAITLKRDATSLLVLGNDGAPGPPIGTTTNLPSGMLYWIDSPAAGTYAYSVVGTTSGQMQNVVLIAMEMP